MAVETYDWAKVKLEQMLAALKKRFDILWLSYHVDHIPSLIQIYRVVGSRTARAGMPRIPRGDTVHGRRYRTGTRYHVGASSASDGYGLRQGPWQRVHAADHAGRRFTRACGTAS